MIPEELNLKYRIEYKKEQPKKEDTVFVFSYDRPKQVAIFRAEELLPLDDAVFFEYAFAINDVPYFILLRHNGHRKKSFRLPKGTEFSRLSSYRNCPDKILVFAIETAWQLFSWYQDNAYCGACGTPRKIMDDSRSLVCTACGNVYFPRIMPAVIVGVVWENKLLLTRYAGREYKGLALIAGFCEVGESAEDTVRREVMEECGVRVKNIRYYKSQPWGFDTNLLLGFFCELDGTPKITMDEDELAAAKFMTADEITVEPDHLSLTNEMIIKFKKEQEGVLA